MHGSSIEAPASLLSRFEHCIHGVNAFEDSIKTVEKGSILEFLYALVEAWRGDW